MRNQDRGVAKIITSLMEGYARAYPKGRDASIVSSHASIVRMLRIGAGDISLWVSKSYAVQEALSLSPQDRSLYCYGSEIPPESLSIRAATVDVLVREAKASGWNIDSGAFSIPGKGMGAIYLSPSIALDCDGDTGMEGFYSNLHESFATGLERDISGLYGSRVRGLACRAVYIWLRLALSCRDLSELDHTSVRFDTSPACQLAWGSDRVSIGRRRIFEKNTHVNMCLPMVWAP